MSVLLTRCPFAGFQLSDRSDCSIDIGRSDVANCDVLLSRLKNCVVRILGSPSTVHIADLDGCKILTGPVRTSVFVERCKKVTLFKARTLQAVVAQL